MDNAKIDYGKLVENLDMIIFQLEYDAMRSGGKAKINVPSLNELYIARERYIKMNKPAKKEG